MPSERHTELQNMVTRWISNRSFKMCGLPESHVVGYLADYVAIAGMHDEYHSRYTRHSGLTKMYMTYDMHNLDKRITKGDIDRWYVCVFEVKISRNDFLNTFGDRKTAHSKARMKPAGTAHWVVAEKGICKPEELPDFWGLLTPYGTGLTELKKPKLNVLQDYEIHAMAFDMLWLTMNFRYSYYDRMNSMADRVKSLHRAIIEKKPIGELLRRSQIAVKACCGLSQNE